MSISNRLKVAVIAAVSIFNLGMIVPASADAIDYTPGFGTPCVNALFDKGSKLVIDGNTAIVSFTVPENCGPMKMSFTAYKKHENVFPLNEQVAFDHQTESFSAGTHNMTVKLPDDCFWQVDLWRGEPQLQLVNDSLGYFNHQMIMAAKTGGSRDCLVTPPVTPTPTPPATVTTEQPTVLVNTGPGSVIAIFAATAAAGFALKSALLRRSLNQS